MKRCIPIGGAASSSLRSSESSPRRKPSGFTACCRARRADLPNHIRGVLPEPSRKPVLTEHEHCESQLTESPEAVHERRPGSRRTAVMLHHVLRREHCSDAQEPGSAFELEL